ncbi:hypothetical protein JZ751_028348 [Albula glossodonta]|uniref:Uncharacterized protein n=1 Tax=Albula glossodonta TaxID=121402 RepID=A0A8T2NJA4_9TELE|nr:hypothetical protein JZ751_028348 [Albula glossodonta]
MTPRSAFAACHAAFQVYGTQIMKSKGAYGIFAVPGAMPPSKPAGAWGSMRSNERESVAELLGFALR